ncbi:hypothetical protein ACFVS2_21040 [Brevibacillus sp. NPDC058079]|uniref:hypothetical protein n=1 Tax=Brevibacillus sp. NPDC058079 TaxID=3346330 RepID=UPI0036E9271D
MKGTHVRSARKAVGLRKKAGRASQKNSLRPETHVPVTEGFQTLLKMNDKAIKIISNR